jgi:hypothetical protein
MQAAVVTALDAPRQNLDVPVPRPPFVPGHEGVERQLDSGYSIDGIFTEHAVVAAAVPTSVPHAVPDLDAAPLTCAGVRAYEGFQVAVQRILDDTTVMAQVPSGELPARVACRF